VNNNYMNNYYVYLNYQLIEAFFEHKYALFVIMPVKSTILTDLQGENNRLGLQTTTLLDYIVSNVFNILGIAHKVPYVVRVDWTPRKLHSNAVFWHTLAPDKLEPPHSVPISLKTQYVPKDLRPLCSSR
jgi:hypothetical protein